MRILLLTPDPPAPNHINGGTTRQFHLYSRLIEAGHEVTVVGPFPHGSTRADELAAAGFEVEAVMRPSSLIGEVLAAVIRRPRLLADAFTQSSQALVGGVYYSRLKQVIERVTANKRFDVVCVEQEFAASWIEAAAPSTPKVLVVQQVESAYRFERAERLSGLSGLRARVDARRAAAFERKWLPRFDAVVAMTEVELDRLRQVAGSLPPSYVIANGADTHWLSDIGPDRGENRVLFTGTLAFEPNAIAAEWIARQVWPRVLESIPSAELQIVGRDPSEATRALAALDGVTLHANVDDMKPFFAASSVCTLPMLEGGGTRLKLAEAFAAGRAVVSTSNGISGIAVRDGEQVLVADDAADFASAIVRLLENSDERARVAASGQAFAASELDWKKLGDRWEQALREVCQRAGG